MGKPIKSLLYLSLGTLVALPVLLALPEHAAPRTAAAQAAASPIVAHVDAAQCAIRWTLGTSLHTVHGTFALKSGTLRIDPEMGQVAGEIVADAASGQSGNDGRDKKMHNEVLESARFGEIVFRPDALTGKLAAQGDSTVQLHGVFRLHGSEHELSIPVEAHLEGDHWTASAKFAVPFIDWGLKNPSTWLLKVDHVENLELELKGTLDASSPK